MTGPVVIKLGGLAIEDPSRVRPLLAAIARAHSEDAEGLVVVHGGGNAVTRQLDAHGLETIIVDGVRVTPASHIAQVVGVLAGQVNTSIMAQLCAIGVKAIGLSLSDGGLAMTRPIKRGATDFGCVGEIIDGDGALIRHLHAAGYLPVLSSIGSDADGMLLNVNADSAAGAIARIVSARMLMLLTDVPGVLDAEGELIDSIDETGIEALISTGVIGGGMIPKVRAALAAAHEFGVPVVIASWNEPDSIVKIIQGGAAGTRVVPTVSQGVHLS